MADLFAGTGALGLEAISRGARFCLFVDDDADSRALQRENVETLGLTGATKIWRRDATDLGPINAGSSGPFDLVFLDPPYKKNLIPPALDSLKDGGWLAKNALLVAETSADENLDVTGFTLLDERSYGEPFIRFLTAAKSVFRYRRASIRHRSGGHGCTGRNGAWLPFRAAGRSSLRH